MSKKIKMLINKINKNCDSLEYGEARRMIELNFKELQNPIYYTMLNSNATVLLKYVLDQQKTNSIPLTRLEQFQISEINKHCTDFDIAMLKRTLKNCSDLLQRPDIDNYLNENAKTILSSMGSLI